MKNNNKIPDTPDLGQEKNLRTISQKHEILMKDSNRLKISEKLNDIAEHLPKFYSTSVKIAYIIGSDYIQYGYQPLVYHILRDIINNLVKRFRDTNQIFDNDKAKEIFTNSIEELQDDEILIDFNNLTDNQKKVIKDIFKALHKYKKSFYNYRDAFRELHLTDQENLSKEDIDDRKEYADQLYDFYMLLHDKAHISEKSDKECTNIECLKHINSFEEMLLELFCPTPTKLYNERKKVIDEILEKTNI